VFDLEQQKNRAHKLIVRHRLQNGGSNINGRGTHSNVKLLTFSFQINFKLLQIKSN
jgi:hypothetical protein